MKEQVLFCNQIEKRYFKVVYEHILMKKYNEVMRKKLSEQYSQIAQKKQVIKSLKNRWDPLTILWKTQSHYIMKTLANIIMPKRTKIWLTWLALIFIMIDLITFNSVSSLNFII